MDILVNIWDKDVGPTLDDLVAEFTFNYTDQPGSRQRNIQVVSEGAVQSWSVSYSQRMG